MTTLVQIDPQAAHVLDVHTQAESQINPTIAAAQEAGDIKVVAVTRMQEAFKSLGKAEDSVSKGLLADAVQSIIPVLGLPEKIRPKYTVIADLINAAMGRFVVSMHQVRLPDGELKMREPKGKVKNAYRQQATPYVKLARWEAGMWTKPEKNHRLRNPQQVVEITYHGEKYTSPVSALKGGVPYMTAYRLFNNLISPTFTDFAKIPSSKSIEAGKKQAAKIKVVTRVKDDDGNIVKASDKAAGNQSLTVGIILGLLDEAPEFTPSNASKLAAALILKTPKSEPTPAPAPATV